MKKLLISILAILTFAVLPGLHSAQADTTNPPKILSVSLINQKNSYSSGDPIEFEIQYSGGNPGIKSALLIFRYTDNSTSGCINPSSAAFWSQEDSGKYTRKDFGLVSPGYIKIISTLTSDCKQGKNDIDIWKSEIVDKSDLKADTHSNEWFGRRNPTFTINVVDGKYLPVGTVIEATKNSSFNLDFIVDEYLLDESRSNLLTFPKKTSEGIYIFYNSLTQDVCRSIQPYPGGPADFQILKTGICKISAFSLSTRSEFGIIDLKKEFVVKSKASAAADKASTDKAAAELKAKQEAAVKAAVELKAKQEADAKAAAELKTKQDAADKAALTKAQSELASANAALADAQKVNRELQTQLNSVEVQFKLLSDSVSVIQGQVSQLNSKLVAALASLNTAKAKLKKVCSVKPKPKGC